jgi:hypothetical protein
MKKLKLRSETVTMLTDNALDKVVGGTSSDTTFTFCGSCGCTQYCYTFYTCDASMLYPCRTRIPE